MWQGPWGCWFPFMWIFPLLFLVVMVVFLFRGASWPMFRGRGTHDRGPSAKEILNRRYASGEIGPEDYQRMKRDLEQ